MITASQVELFVTSFPFITLWFLVCLLILYIAFNSPSSPYFARSWLSVFLFFISYPTFLMVIVTFHAILLDCILINLGSLISAIPLGAFAINCSDFSFIPGSLLPEFFFISFLVEVPQLITGGLPTDISFMEHTPQEITILHALPITNGGLGDGTSCPADLGDDDDIYFPAIEAPLQAPASPSPIRLHGVPLQALVEVINTITTTTPVEPEPLLPLTELALPAIEAPLQAPASTLDNWITSNCINKGLPTAHLFYYTMLGTPHLVNLFSDYLIRIPGQPTEQAELAINFFDLLTDEEVYRFSNFMDPEGQYFIAWKLSLIIPDVYLDFINREVNVVIPANNENESQLNNIMSNFEWFYRRSEYTWNWHVNLNNNSPNPQDPSLTPLCDTQTQQGVVKASSYVKTLSSIPE
jgi:hypothetical protein